LEVTLRDRKKRTPKAGPAELTDEELAKSHGGTTLTASQSKRGFIKSWSTSGDADDRPTEEIA
jgi:hypothetical protein